MRGRLRIVSQRDPTQTERNAPCQLSPPRPPKPPSSTSPPSARFRTRPSRPSPPSPPTCRTPPRTRPRCRPTTSRPPKRSRPRTSTSPRSWSPTTRPTSSASSPQRRPLPDQVHPGGRKFSGHRVVLTISQHHQANDPENKSITTYAPSEQLTHFKEISDA